MTEELFARFEQRFERFVEYVEGRFQHMEGRFQDMEGRFRHMEGRFQDMEGRFQDMEGRFQDMEGRFAELPTREEWSQFATKTDLAQFATKADLKEEIGTLRLEMRERFETVHDRLAALEKGHEDLRSGVAQVREQVNELGSSIEKLEAVGRDTNLRLIHLRDDMQQRFREVNERLRSVEQRIAA